mgnify:CR=1 FL=1
MTSACDTRKRRELVFHAIPLGQADQALHLLSGLPDFSVARLDAQTLLIDYDVSHYALEDIENALTAQGFHLEASLFVRVRRALAYHCERVQRRNLGTPAPRTKNYKAFIEAWGRHPHGDHDATPEEWRKYK